MATKCVAQMPKPVEMAETVNHTLRMRPVGITGITQQPDRSDRGQNAHKSGKRDELKIVLGRDTVINLQHEDIPLCGHASVGGSYLVTL